jgi:positive regulator of sigma E activity
MLLIVLILGACVSAIVSESTTFRIGGIVGLCIGFSAIVYFSKKNEVRYDWDDEQK